MQSNLKAIDEHEETAAAAAFVYILYRPKWSRCKANDVRMDEVEKQQQQQ